MSILLSLEAVVCIVYIIFSNVCIGKLCGFGHWMCGESWHATKDL